MKKKALQVLLVEDNAGDVRLLREMFGREPPQSFELTHLMRLREALDHLTKDSADIILLDMGLPDGHGLDTVRQMRAAAPDVPVIVLTGLDDETLAAEAIEAGAQDYLIKGQIENRALPRVLRHAIERYRMQRETDLIRMNQMQFKDEFLSHVSHELRSPLTAIYQFVTILLDRLAGDLKLEQSEYLEIVLRNVKQLQAMIDDLLEVTRIQAGKLTIELQCISVFDAIVDTVNTLKGTAAAKGITLSADVDRMLPLACADPTRVRQVLIILADNAVKFTPQNGTVTIRARSSDDGSSLVVEVVDSGCGISSDMMDRIFERLFQASDFASASRKGLGLGLYICKELVTRQGGQIWAQSTPGNGAIFSVTLPVFSLANLIAPALGTDGRRDRPTTLVLAEIGSQTGWLSNEQRSECAEIVRPILQNCLHSDHDVLLPKMGVAGAAELFFIVALTDAIGGESITKRIDRQLDDCAYLNQAGLTYATSFRPLDAMKLSARKSTKSFLDEVAIDIQHLVNEELSSRAVKNG